MGGASGMRWGEGNSGRRGSRGKLIFTQYSNSKHSSIVLFTEEGTHRDMTDSFPSQHLNAGKVL